MAPLSFPPLSLLTLLIAPSCLRCARLLAPLLVLVGAALGPAMAEEARKEAPKETMRNEVIKPLLDAQKALKEKKYDEAATALKAAEAVTARTPFENYNLESLRLQLAIGRDDRPGLRASLETLLGTTYIEPRQRTVFRENVVSMAYEADECPAVRTNAALYLKEGGKKAVVSDMMVSCLMKGKDYAGAVPELQRMIAADEAEGTRPSTQRLKWLARSCEAVKDAACTDATVFKLLRLYPEKDHWDLAFDRVVHHTGYATRLDLDALRLQLLRGELGRDAELVDMAAVAREAGYAIEAERVLRRGFEQGILGKGPNAAKQKAMLDKAAAEAKKDNTTLDAEAAQARKEKRNETLFNVGYNMALFGRYEAGIALMIEALEKGGLKHPEESRLHLGQAYLMAGQRDKAIATWAAVGGNEGAAQMAQLWTVYAQTTAPAATSTAASTGAPAAAAAAVPATAPGAAQKP